MVVVTAASVPERAGAKLLLAQLEQVRHWFTRLVVIWVDGGYSGIELRKWVMDTYRWVFETVLRTDQDKRAIALQLDEEELAIFDLLTLPDVTLTKKEEQEVKKVAGVLLETLKREKLVLDWRKRQQSRAAVKLTIDEILDQLPQCLFQSLIGIYRKSLP